MNTCTEQQLTQFLHALKGHNALNAEEEQLLRGLCSCRTYTKGEVLQPIGHTCRTYYFLLSGIARIFYYKNETDITEHFAFENSFVVRFESLYTGKPSTKAIELLDESVVLSISALALEKLFDRYPQIERVFRKAGEAAHVETINRIESLQFHTAEERYEALVKQKPDVILRVPQKYIASYLGITPVSLSRIRGKK